MFAVPIKKGPRTRGGTQAMFRKIHKRMKGEKGFTLIELLVVIIIIAILAAIAIPTFLGQRQKAQDAAAKSLVRNAMMAVESAYTDTRDFTDVTAAMLTDIEPSIVFAIARGRSHGPERRPRVGQHGQRRQRCRSRCLRSRHRLGVRQDVRRRQSTRPRTRSVPSLPATTSTSTARQLPGNPRITRSWVLGPRL